MQEKLLFNMLQRTIRHSPTKQLRFNALFESSERRNGAEIIKKILERNKNLLFDWIRSFVIKNNNTFIRNKALRVLGYLIETEDYNFIIFSCKVQLHEYGYSIKS